MDEEGGQERPPGVRRRGADGEAQGREAKRPRPPGPRGALGVGPRRVAKARHHCAEGSTGCGAGPGRKKRRIPARPPDPDAVPGAVRGGPDAPVLGLSGGACGRGGPKVGPRWRSGVPARGRVGRETPRRHAGRGVGLSDAGGGGGDRPSPLGANRRGGYSSGSRVARARRGRPPPRRRGCRGGRAAPASVDPGDGHRRRGPGRASSAGRTRRPPSGPVPGAGGVAREGRDSTGLPRHRRSARAHLRAASPAPAGSGGVTGKPSALASGRPPPRPGAPAAPGTGIAGLARVRRLGADPSNGGRKGGSGGARPSSFIARRGNLNGSSGISSGSPGSVLRGGARSGAAARSSDGRHAGRRGTYAGRGAPGRVAREARPTAAGAPGRGAAGPRGEASRRVPRAAPGGLGLVAAVPAGARSSPEPCPGCRRRAA